MYTVGHSTRSMEEFLELLRKYGIGLLVDIRTIPYSRRNPHFNSGSLAASLADERIGYWHHPGLGGLRRPASDSPNTGWRNSGFRGFADYMLTCAFEDALNQLLSRTEQAPLVLMCAEALYWRCHRKLVSDALEVRGLPVFHIVSVTHAERHKITDFARIEGTRILYSASPQQSSLDFPS